MIRVWITVYVPDESGYEFFGQINGALSVQMSQKRHRGQQSAHEYERVRVEARRARYHGPLFAEVLENYGVDIIFRSVDFLPGEPGNACPRNNRCYYYRGSSSNINDCFRTSVIAVLFEYGLKNIAIDLWDASNINAFSARIPWIDFMSSGDSSTFNSCRTFRFAEKE